MTHRGGAGRTIRVDALARVEGEGALFVDVHDGRVRDVQLRIYEPPRFFEAFLRGRLYTEPPDITARICGICPVAYQMSACQAVEAACGVTVDGPLRDLRRLLYCGEWIESHVLHIHLLHAPDFLGVDSAIDLARTEPELVQRALDLKKVGNDIVELIGGRPIHPVNVRLGGFYRVPTRAELAPLAARLPAALAAAEETVRFVADFDFPELRRDDVELVALRSDSGYAVLDGRLQSTGGLDIGPEELSDVVEEIQVPHSNALHGRLRDRGEHLVGPMARFALNHDRLLPRAAAAASAAGLDPDERNPFRSIVVRAVEVVQALEQAIVLCEAYEPPPESAVAVPPRRGVGSGWSEAPRGLLWHRYELDDGGVIADAVIVPPTAQNQPSIEHDLFHLVERNLDLDDDGLRAICEQAIRNYDPCISCATHFLDLTVDRS
jgi:coenzyme F420-reducing hydrogenase alpha subunit